MASSWARAARAFLLKRLSDAERDGDKIYAVIRGVGGSSDGKGKGITAPNPIGQILAAQRGLGKRRPGPGHRHPAGGPRHQHQGRRRGRGGEPGARSSAAPRGSIALGSAKSNIGHLKAGAGAAGLLKAVMAVHEKVLPPTLNAERPNPNIDFSNSPFYLNHDLQEWAKPNGVPAPRRRQRLRLRRHQLPLVLEEHVPGMLRSEKTLFSGCRCRGKQVDKETGSQVDKETGRQVDKETGRQVDKETGRQVNK